MVKTRIVISISHRIFRLTIDVKVEFMKLSPLPVAEWVMEAFSLGRAKPSPGNNCLFLIFNLYFLESVKAMKIFPIQ